MPAMSPDPLEPKSKGTNNAGLGQQHVLARRLGCGSNVLMCFINQLVPINTLDLNPAHRIPSPQADKSTTVESFIRLPHGLTRQVP